jgi:FKBP-type peptidyl-prolyl cis-trans isomerase
MKLKSTLKASALLLGLAAGLSAQDAATPAPAPATPPAEAAPQYNETQVLEAFGWYIGKSNGLSELGFSKEQADAIVRGLMLARDGKEAPTDLQKIGPEIDKLLRGKQEKYLAKMKEESSAKAEKLFAELKAKPGVVALPSGVYYEILKPGEGAYPTANDTVKIHYTGTLVDGSKFDSSLDRGEPSEFPLGNTVPGFTEGVQKINKGGKIKLWIPAALGYGDQARPGIPPGSTLVFEVELFDFKAGEAPPAPELPPTPAPAPAPGAK